MGNKKRAKGEGRRAKGQRRKREKPFLPLDEVFLTASVKTTVRTYRGKAMQAFFATN